MASIKIDPTSRSAVAHHINDGPVTFPYAVDAHHAVSSFPMEWSAEPWTAEAATAAREQLQASHDQQVADARARGLPVPQDLPPPPPEPTPEEQAAIMEHAQAVAEANERLKTFREKQAAEQAVAEQVAADEALVASPPPRPDPNVRRPLSRAQKKAAFLTLTPEEQAAKDARDKAEDDAAAAKKAADDKVVADKAVADALAAASQPAV